MFKQQLVRLALLALLAAPVATHAQTVTVQNISRLNQAGTITGTEYFWGVQNGQAVRITISQADAALCISGCTLNSANLNNPVITGTVTGSYLLSGTPSLNGPLLLPNGALFNSTGTSPIYFKLNGLYDLDIDASNNVIVHQNNVPGVDSGGEQLLQVQGAALASAYQIANTSGGLPNPGSGASSSLAATNNFGAVLMGAASVSPIDDVELYSLNTGQPGLGLKYNSRAIESYGNHKVDGHLLGVGGSPSLGACGSGGSLTTNSSDTRGSFTTGTSNGGSCTLNFGTSYATFAPGVSGVAPYCVASSNQATPTSTVSATAVTFTVNSTGGAVVNYICMG